MVEFSLVISLAVRSCRRAREGGEDYCFPQVMYLDQTSSATNFNHVRRAAVLGSPSAIASISFVIDWIVEYLNGLAPLTWIDVDVFGGASAYLEGNIGIWKDMAGYRAI